MPIRFRCVYCNQLMRISRRKAGTIVSCTKCAGQLIVPSPDEGTTEPAPEPPAQVAAAQEEPPALKPDLFEQSDFDALLEPYASGAIPAAVVSPPKLASPRQTTARLGGQSAGLLLTRGHLTLVSVLLVLTVGLAFAGGLILGLSLRGG